MKKLFILTAFVLMLSACMFTIGSAMAAEENNVPATESYRICVAGVGKICVKADSAELRFGIQCREKQLDVSRKGAIKIYNDVLEKLSEAEGVQKDSSDIIYINTYPVNENGLSAFETNMEFFIRIKGIDGCEKVIETATNSGITRFNGIQYMLENPDAAYIKALGEAKKNAQEKVNGLESGMVLREIIETGAWHYCEPCSEGNIIVEARINAVYSK